MKIFTIIAAGGSGRRMGKSKQFLPLLGKPMLEWTVETFKSVKAVNGIVIVTAKENFNPAKKLSNLVCESGPERYDSVKNGLDLVPSDTDIVLVHDGARPLVTPKIIKQSIEACLKFDAVVVGVPVKDTIKKIRNPKYLPAGRQVEIRNKSQIINPKIQTTVDRDLLWAAQTPQVFKYSILKRAYGKDQDQVRDKVTDDAMLVEDLGIPVTMIMGSYENIKITTPEDIAIAEAILKRRRK